MVLMKWIDKMANKVVTLTGQQNSEHAEFIGVVASFAIFAALAYMVIVAVSFVTGISTSALWSALIVLSLIHYGWQTIRQRG